LKDKLEETTIKMDMKRKEKPEKSPMEDELTKK